MTTPQQETQDLLDAGRWQEVLRAGPAFRLLPSSGGRHLLQRYDGHYGGNNIWRTLFGGPIDCPELAADMLAVAEGRMTHEEQGRRWSARKRAANAAAKVARNPTVAEPLRSIINSFSAGVER